MANEYLRQSNLRDLIAFSPEEDQERIYAEQLADQGGYGTSLEQELSRTKDPRAIEALRAELESRGGDYAQSTAPRSRPAGLDDFDLAYFGSKGGGRRADFNEESFDDAYFSSPVQAAEESKRRSGLVDTVKGGFSQMARSLGAAVDLHQGDVEELRKAGAEATADAANKDKDLLSLLQDIRKSALGADAGWFDTGKALLAAAANNPRGAGLLIAEQLPNSAAVLGAAGAGAAAGSLLGPVGTVAGGIIGMFGANYGLEGGGKAVEAAQQGRLSPEDLEQVKEEGLIKAGVITGVDAATFGIGGKIAGTAQRAVDRAGAKVLQEAGVNVADRAAIIAAVEANPALVGAVQAAEQGAYKAATTLGQRAMRGGAGVSLETLGEGIGEYYGEGLATGNWDKMEALIEAFSSLGQSAGEVAINAARNKVDPTQSILSAPDIQSAIEAANKSLDLNQSLDQAAPGMTPAVTAYEQEVLAQPGATGEWSAMDQQAQLGEFEKQLNADRDRALNDLLQGQKTEAIDTTIDPVRGYVEEQRRLATPAAMEFVRQFDNGTITADQVQQRIDTEQSRLGKTDADIRIENAAAESIGQDMAPPANQDLRTQQMQNSTLAMQANQAQRAQAQQVSDNESGQFSQNRTSQQQTADVQAATTPAVGRVTQDTRDLSAKVPGNPQISDVTVEAMSGKVQSMPKLVAHTVQKLGKMLGRRVVFFSGGGVDGTVFRDKNDNRIFVNADASVNPIRVLGHEMMHRLKTESPVAYAALRKALREGGIITDDMLADYDRDYNSDKYRGLDEDGVKARRDAVLAEIKAGNSEHLLEEMLSDLNGNRFMEPDFWGNVFQKIEEQEGREKAKGIIAKLREALTLLISKLQKALAGSKEFDADKQILENLQQVRAALEDAFAAYMGDLKKAGNRLEEMGANPTATAAAVEQSADDNPKLSPRRNDPAWNDALKMWLAMSSHNELFKYPKSDKEKMQDIFADIMPEAKVSERFLLDDRDKRYDVVKKWIVTVGDGSKVTIYQDKKGDVWVNAMGLKSGKSEGAAVYAALLNYTHNNMLRMVGDPLGVSDMAVFRRTENMLASALKFGTTDHMMPADEQARPEYYENQMGHLPGVTDKFEPLRWDQSGDHLANLTNLLYSSYSNVKSFVPEIENVTYNFASRRFEWAGTDNLVTEPEWQVLSQRLRDGLAGIASDFERIGTQELARKSGEDSRSATLQRAALTNTLLRETSEGKRGSLLAEIRSQLQSEGLSKEQKALSYSPKRTSDVGHKRTKAGDYVGAPPGMTSAKLGALRNRLRALTKEGEPGRFWYEDSSDLILAAAEGDKALAEKIAGLLAIYSPQATVSANTSMGLKALYQWMEGNPIRVRFGHQDRKAQAWMDGTIAEEDALQIKTGNFFRNLMRKIDEERYGYDKQGATIDMWMARVFGYGSKAIGSEARYLFAERETKRLAEELGWEPQQVQAALWVAIKSRIEAIADEAREIGKKKGWLERKVTKHGSKENISWPPLAEHKEKYESLILKMALAQEADPSGIIGAAYHFGTALRERVGQISWEAMPGKTTGVLPGVFDAPLEQQLEYLVAMDKALRDENGQDLIAKKLGLPVIGTAMGPSAWQMNVGAGAQTEVAVATDRDQDNKRVSVTAPAKKLLNMYAAIRGYVLNQEAVVWHYPIYKAAKKDANGVQIDFGRDPTHDEVVELYNAIHEVSGREDWAPAYVPGVGVRILNFSDVPNLEFHKLIKKAADAAEISDYRAQTFMSDGDYISNDWVSNPDGKQYKEVFDGQVSKLDAREEGRPDLQGWVEGFLRPRAERVNKEFANRYGWAKLSPARSDGAGSAAGGSLSRSVGEGSRPGSVSATGIHYSQEKRSFLDSGYFGRGTKSEELERVMDAPDERIKHRIYFYVNEGRGIQPENGVGSHAHKYDLTNLYDLTADRDDLYAKFWRNKNALESAILDAGYDGWTGGGIAILLGKRSIVPEYVGQFVKPEVTERQYSEKSPYGKLQQAVVKNNSLPGGEMSGADWKRLMPKLMPEVDVSHLEDEKRYYKDQIVKRPDATDQGGVSLSTSRQTETPEFKRWSKGRRLIRLGEQHEYADGEGVVVETLHGTTGDFNTFNRGAANIESDLGGGFYFTNNPDDVSENYAGLGPDLTKKVELEAERIESQSDGAVDMEEARKMARDQFMANEGFTMPVFVRFYNPVVLGGSQETFLDINENYNEETDEYDEPTGKLVEFVEALREVGQDERYGDADVERAISDLLERAADNDGLTARELIKILSSSEGLQYATDYENERGALASKEIIRKAFEAAGFDGFIDQTVDEKFGSQSEGQRKFGKGMAGMNKNTVHFIAFDPAQIKSAIGNNGDFNPENPDIRMSTQRQTETPAFRNWFGESKVVDAEGKPLVVYHNTKADFSKFYTFSEMGAHFGTINQANDFPHEGRNTMPVYLRLERPLRLVDVGDFTYPSVAGQLEDLGLLSSKEASKYYRVAESGGDAERQTKKLQGVIKSLGYDGIVYVNRREGVDSFGPDGFDGDTIAEMSDDEFLEYFPDAVDSYLVFDPTQIKSATGNNGQFDASNPDIRYSLPRQSQWYYSQLSRQIESAPDKVFGPAKQVKAWLQSNAGKLGIKADEIQWTGINDWLDLQQRVTKADVLGYLQQNGVQVQEVMKGGVDDAEVEAWWNDEGGANEETPFGELTPAEQAEARNRYEEDVGTYQDGGTKYSQYVLPGGENYRELLLTLPKKKATVKPDGEKFAVMLPDGRRFGLYSSLADAESALNRTDGQIGPNFQSQHWSDTKNVLAHIRFNDRTDADGKRVLFIEELQSDWGQKGKKDGFGGRETKPLAPGEYIETIERWREELAQMWVARGLSIEDARNGTRALPHSTIAQMTGHAAENEELNRRSAEDAAYGGHFNMQGMVKVPRAPFVTDTKSWVALAVKRMIAHAVENGYDKVAFVTGEQSAERYDLSKQVDSIAWQKQPDGKFNIQAIKGEEELSQERGLSDTDLAEAIGKDAAEKIVARSESAQMGTLRGLDLKVGGEGMKSFYDRIVPQVVNDVLKKVGGGRVEGVRLSDSSFNTKQGVEDDALLAGLGVEVEGKRPLEQPGFTITPEMREKVAGGQALFSTRRIIGDSGRQHTAEQVRAFERTGRIFDEKNLYEKVKEFVAKRWQQGIFDQFAPFRSIDRNAYTLMRLSKGATGAFEALMHHGKLSLRDGAYDADTSGGVIESVFAPIGKESTDFLYWVAGNRAERLKREGKENLMDDRDIQAFKALDNGVTDFDYTLSNGQVTRDRTRIYADTLKKFNSFNKNVLDMAEQSGLIDPASRQFWEHEFYVPFYRVLEEDEIGGGNISKGVVRQKAFEKLKGGTGELNDLLANTLMNWHHLIDAGAKNRAAKAAVEAADRMGIAHRALSGEKKTVWFMDNGVKREYKIDDPAVMEAITGLEYAGMHNLVMDVLTKPKHWLTIGVTASPFFKVRNLIRDSVQAIATSDLSYNPIKNVVEGAKLTSRDRQEYVSALAGGGLIRFGTMLEGNEAARTRQLIKKASKDGHILDSEGALQKFYDKYLEPGVMAYNELGNRGEEINRMSLYDQLIKQGVDHATASLMARDLMDFSLQGSFTTIRFLAQVVPFFNARIQGMYKLGRATKENREHMAVVVFTAAVASLALMALAASDDDSWKRWKKREEWDKASYWWFEFAGVQLRIPKPFELGAVAHLAERSVEAMFDSERDAGKRYGKAIMDLAWNQLSMSPVPQAIKPIIDLYANKDSFTGRPIETMAMQRLTPTERYTAQTSMPARLASEATFGALSPVQFDHIVRSYFGWLGATAVGTADIMARSINNEPTKPALDYWKFATGGMVQEDQIASRYVSMMYEQAAELEQAHATYNRMRKEGKLDEAKEFAEDNADKLKAYRGVENVKKQVSQINERIRMIERSDIHPAEKRIKIRALKEQASEIAARLSN